MALNNHQNRNLYLLINLLEESARFSSSKMAKTRHKNFIPIQKLTNENKLAKIDTPLPEEEINMKQIKHLTIERISHILQSVELMRYLIISSVTLHGVFAKSAVLTDSDNLFKVDFMEIPSVVLNGIA